MAIQESDNRALWLIATSLEHIAYTLDRICPPAQSVENNTKLYEDELCKEEDAL